MECGRARDPGIAPPRARRSPRRAGDRSDDRAARRAGIGRAVGGREGSGRRRSPRRVEGADDRRFEARRRRALTSKFPVDDDGRRARATGATRTFLGGMTRGFSSPTSPWDLARSPRVLATDACVARGCIRPRSARRS
eukprot:30465-Pelagococcus_subviridis.AAC.7